MINERLIKDLRMYANDPGYSHSDYEDVLTSAADEIERIGTQLEQENKRLRYALQELVLVKQHKDQYGKDAKYLLMRDKAWADAFAAL